MTVLTMLAKRLGRTDSAMEPMLQGLSPEDGSVEFKQTFTQHHYTLYAEPEQILALAELVAVPIPQEPGD